MGFTFRGDVHLHLCLVTTRRPLQMDTTSEGEAYLKHNRLRLVAVNPKQQAHNIIIV